MLVSLEPSFVYSNGKPVYSWLISKSADIFLYKSSFCISNSWCFDLLTLRLRHPLDATLSWTRVRQLAETRTFFWNITSTVFIWKKKVIYCTPKDGFRVSKSWGHFHFWWAIPLMVVKQFQFSFTSIVFLFSFFVQSQWKPELFGYQHSSKYALLGHRNIWMNNYKTLFSWIMCNDELETQ